MAISGKNPMVQMFGTYLRLKRNAGNKSVADAARILGVGSSFVRAIEAGSYPLNPNRIDKLRQLLSEEYIDPERAINFFIGLQFVQFQMEAGETGYEALKKLSDLTEDFKKFYENVKVFFEYSEDSLQQKKFLEEKAILEVTNFLTQKFYVEESRKQFNSVLIDTIRNTRTIHLETIMEVRDLLERHPPLHVGDVAANWENINAKRLKCLKGIFQEASYIISESNVRKFTYDYLFEEKFEFLNFIFLEGDTEKILKEKFVTLLNDARKKVSKKELTQSEVDKINIRCVKYLNVKSECDKVLEGENSIIINSKAFWVFSMISGNEIGFIGVPQAEDYKVLNLTYKDTLERIKYFDNIWELAG
jgi:transcriptional regulator with XRE-family HTH domain